MSPLLSLVAHHGCFARLLAGGTHVGVVGKRSGNLCRFLSSRFESSSRASSPLPPTADPQALRLWVNELREKDKRRLVHVLASDLSLKLASDDTAEDSDDLENVDLNLSLLSQLAFFHALPFVGFGFLDNLIMIVAGEYIDHTLGITLGISTMAAAGLGNALSDVFGIGSAWYVEHWAIRLGVRPPDISTQQAGSTKARMAANIGRALGVVIGCLIGMFPLLFIDTEPKAKPTENPSPIAN